MTDNDSLASYVAVEMESDLLVLLSDIDGIYSGPPSDPSSRLIRHCHPGMFSSITIGKKSSTGRGGMKAKVIKSQAMYPSFVPYDPTLSVPLPSPSSSSALFSPPSPSSPLPSPSLLPPAFSSPLLLPSPPLSYLQLEAVQYACERGCAVVIANGKSSSPQLLKVIEGGNVGTLVTRTPSGTSLSCTSSLEDVADQGEYT